MLNGKIHNKLCPSHSVYNHQPHSCKQVRLPIIYFSYGSEEIELVTKKCKIMYEIIKDKPHISARIFEGAHDYFYWQEDLINALKILKEKL